MLKAVMQVNMRREERYRNRDKYSVCWQDSNGRSASTEAESINLSQSGVLIRSGQELLPDATVFIQAISGDLEPMRLSGVAFAAATTLKSHWNSTRRSKLQFPARRPATSTITNFCRLARKPILARSSASTGSWRAA